MKPLEFSVVLIAFGIACSSSENRVATADPVLIDKNEIDVAKMNTFFTSSSPSTNLEWQCFILSSSEPLTEDQSSKFAVAKFHSLAKITEGSVVLASGQISGVLWDSSRRFAGYSIQFESPGKIEELEKKLGVHHPIMPTPTDR